MASNQPTLISDQSEAGKNRRRSIRRRITTLAYIDLGSNNGGTLINVGDGGLSFQGVQPLELGEVFEVGFKLPGINQSFKVSAEIAWLGESRKCGGLRFVELTEEDKNLVEQWAATKESGDPGGQCTSLPSQIEPERNYSRTFLRSLVQQNRPAAEKNKNLVDLLRDPGLPQDAVIAAVNASRGVKNSPNPADPPRAPRLPHPHHATERVHTNSILATWRIPIVFALAFVGILGLAIVQHYRGPASGAASTAYGDSPLELRVERTGETWQVRWNRNSDVLAKAVSGSLSITDGPSHKEMQMDVSELRSGSILYMPATDDVVLRLQVVTENSAQPVSESVRIVSGKLP